MDDDHDAAGAFIERMGLSAQGDGLPRIAGRMMGYFIIHGGPTSLAELAKALRVSRASVSTNARVLRDLGILEATTVPGDRQDYYRLVERHYVRLLEGYVQRMGTLDDSLERARRDLPEDWQAARERVADMHAFVHIAREHTRALIERLAARDRARSE